MLNSYNFFIKIIIVNKQVTIESVGIMNPKDIFRQSISILSKKADDYIINLE